MNPVFEIYANVIYPGTYEYNIMVYLVLQQ